MNKLGVQMLFETMQIVQSTRTTLQVTSAFLRTFREKIWRGPQKSKKCPKNSRNWRLYYTFFGLFPGPELRTPRIPPRGMGGHWKAVTCLGSNMWMHLRSLRGSFRFHEKWTNEVFRGLSSQCKLCQAHVRVTSHDGTPRNVLGENMTRIGKVTKCPKNSQSWKL